MGKIKYGSQFLQVYVLDPSIFLMCRNKICQSHGQFQNLWNPSTDEKEEILKDVIGPSGNLRAPAWRIGTEFIVGFNPELYEEMFG